MRSRTDGGFALVEAIAALAISAIAAAALMATLGSAGIRSAEAEIRDAALRQAKAVLTEALAATDEAAFPSHGELGNSHVAWTVRFGPPHSPWNGLQQVEVEVVWTASGKRGATRLAAYRLAPAETPL